MIEDSIVAVCRADGQVVGTGFFAADGVIITCAHVILAADPAQTGQVMVRLQATGETLAAATFTLASAQPKAPGAKDVAILRLDRPLPANIPCLTLHSSQASDDKPFRSFGYARIGRVGGTLATGTIRGRVQDDAGQPLLQLHSAEANRGMSGAPVVVGGQVVGMISDGLSKSENAKQRDLVLAVPAETLWEVYPPLRPATTWENPFYVSGRINDPTYFYGRQREIREIQAELNKGASVALIGETRIGKSSLLYHLHQTAPTWLRAGTTPVFLDLQRIFDEDDLCQELLAHLHAPGKTIRELRRALSEQNVLLLLDEAEKLTQPDFSPRIFDLLRSHAQDANFNLCLTAQKSVIETFIPRLPMSPFHNIFMEKWLGPFTRQEAEAFLWQRLSLTGITFSEQEMETLLDESQRKPALLQTLAHRLFSQKVRQVIGG